MRTSLEVRADGGDAGRSGFDGGPFDAGPGRDAGPAPDTSVLPDIGITCTSDRQCDDGLVCDGTESCVAGRCQHGAPIGCASPIPCVVAQCVDAAGGCVSRPDDTRCPPGERCDPMIGCVGGPCMPTERRERTCHDGVDNDCNGAIDCADPTCQRRDPGCMTMCVPIAPLEVNCFDGRDDDCNGLIDCMDPACAMQCMVCMPTAPFEAGCHDGVDNDCNGVTDCADPYCQMTDPTCSGPCVPTQPIETSCHDGLDNDCNGRFDCVDPNCIAIDPSCGTMCVRTMPIEQFCFDGVDNDCNGLTDCRDPNCQMIDPRCRTCVPTAPFESSCTDGLDNDCNGVIDCADPFCAGQSICSPTDAGRPDCNTVGCPIGESCCSSTGACYASSCLACCMPIPIDAGPTPDSGVCLTHELGVAACTNGADDDCDGRIDCADSDCNALPPVGECCNGRDDNMNGFVDEFSCRCFDQSTCTSLVNPDYVCWSSSYSVCAPPCNQLGGNSFCTMFLAGTTCNTMTGQCQ